MWTFKPMQLPLKQHSFKKMSKSNDNYTKTFDLCWTIFLAQEFLGDYLVYKALGSCFKSQITRWTGQKNWNCYRTSLMGTEWADWWKKRVQKSRDTVSISIKTNSYFLGDWEQTRKNLWCFVLKYKQSNLWHIMQKEKFPKFD